jgi:hypothetical protein
MQARLSPPERRGAQPPSTIDAAARFRGCTRCAHCALTNPFARVGSYASSGPTGFKDHWKVLKFWSVEGMRQAENAALV